MSKSNNKPMALVIGAAVATGTLVADVAQAFGVAHLPHHGAPGGVDQDGAVFHALKLSLSDHTHRGGRCRHM